MAPQQGVSTQRFVVLLVASPSSENCEITCEDVLVNLPNINNSDNNDNGTEAGIGHRESLEQRTLLLLRADSKVERTFGRCLKGKTRLVTLNEWSSRTHKRCISLSDECKISCVRGTVPNRSYERQERSRSCLSVIVVLLIVMLLFMLIILGDFVTPQGLRETFGAFTGTGVTAMLMRTYYRGGRLKGTAALG